MAGHRHSRSAHDRRDLNETGQPWVHRIKGGAKVRHEIAALPQVLARPTPTSVHDEVGHLQRGLCVLLAHEIAFDRDRRAAFLEGKALECVHQKANQLFRAGLRQPIVRY